jgi:hypothetical protein
MVLQPYDTQKWRALLISDADISRLAKALEPYGQKYLDEFAAAYLALNDKNYLPMILRKIVASAARDSGQDVPSDFPDQNINADAVVDNGLKIEGGPETERVSQLSGRNFSAHVDASAVGMTAAEETNRQPSVTGADSSVSTARAAEARNPEPPAVSDAALGPDEKNRTQETDAIDADNLTRIFDRLSDSLPPKTE